MAEFLDIGGRLLVVSLQLPRARYHTSAQQALFFDELGERLAGTSGVRLVGLYGLEQVAASGALVEVPEAERWRPAVTGVVERLRAEKAAVEEQLRLARDERAKLQRDIHAIQQQAESSWATERMENALLRERINDIAAEVAKLAMQLEGPNSPIESLLAAEPMPAKVTRPPNGTPANDTAPPVIPEGGGTLADRIRALQSHASRARQQQPG